ncbi:MAG: branched-chain amino acid ABC transporter permease [Deltaproteobacteria bacterium]|nr:branched-chain amino acid ABC transporter permease [Deltaproteobacteria bacterium]
MIFFLQLLLNGVSLGFLYGISALGFILIYRTGGLLNFAHGGMMAFGAFVFFALSVWADYPIILSFAITLASSFTLGLILERCFMRTLQTRDNLIQNILMTLGLALMLKGVLSFIFGTGSYHLPLLIPETFSFGWHHLKLTPLHISAFIAGISVLLLYGYFFTFSSQGLAMRSFAENRTAARSMGVPVKQVFALSWAIAALICAISGMILGMINGLHVYSLSALGLKVFPVIILGGLNSVGGAILGGIIIGLLETLSGGYISQSLQDIIPYIALVLILIVKPSGFFGRAEPEKV